MGKPVICLVRDNDWTSRPTDITFKNKNQLFKTKEEKMKNYPLPRWLLIILLLMTFTLSGCGGSDEDDGDASEGRSSEIIGESEEAETEDGEGE